MDLLHVPLNPIIDRVAVPFGQPKQPIAAAMALLAVREVEKLPRRTRGVQSERPVLESPGDVSSPKSVFSAVDKLSSK